MNISLLDVTGPVMIGPSSSHTAGAVALARLAAQWMESPIQQVTFGSSGSFARTYRGHGTDIALVAGVLGMQPSDIRVPQSFEIAEKQGLCYHFFRTDLRDIHENACQLQFTLENGTTREIIGCSIGGGRICIRRIDGFDTELYWEAPTLMVLHRDQKGMLSRITGEIAARNLNIAVLRCSRRARGDIACCVIESDQSIPHEIRTRLQSIPGILSATIIDVNTEVTF